MKRNPLLACGLVFLLLAAVAAYVLGIGRAKPTQPLATASVGMSRDAMTTASTKVTSGQPEGFLRARTLLIWAEDSHPLSQRITEDLRQQLTKGGTVDHVTVLTSPTLPLTNTPGPDLFLRLSVAEAQGLSFFARNSKAEVNAMLGTAPFQSSHIVYDSARPPLVEFSWNTTVRLESQFSGVRSDTTGAIAAQIAAHLASGVSNELHTLATDSPILPGLPSQCYGPYQPAPPFDFIKDNAARVVCSYPDLLSHNRTFWTFQTTNAEPRIQRMILQLEATGWKVQDHTEQPRYVRLGKEGAQLELFTQRKGALGADIHTPAAEVPFVVHYWKPFSVEEREAALTALFEQPMPAEMLVPFDACFTPTLRGKLVERLTREKPVSAGAYLFLAEHHLSEGRADAAKEALETAQLMTMTAANPDAFKSRIESTAKRLSPDRTQPLAVTADLCRKAGFLDAAIITGTTNISKLVGEPLVFFGPGTENPEVVAVRLDILRGGAHRYTVVTTKDSSRSTSSTTLPAKASIQHSDELTLGVMKLRTTAKPDSAQRQVVWDIERVH